MESSSIDLAKYRFQDAVEKLKSAKILLRENQSKDTLSRSYYAMFSAVRALLALKNVDSSKHSGIISLFNLHFVKTKAVSTEAGRVLKKAQHSRERSDYGDYVVVTIEEAENQVKDAEMLLSEIKTILEERIGKIEQML